MPSQNFENHSSRFEESTRYFAGAHIGQARHPTCIAVLRRHRVREWFGHPKRPEQRIKSEDYKVGYLERLAPGTTYDHIADHIAGLRKRPLWAGNIEFSLDATRVGRPVADLFETDCKVVMITAGDTATREDYRTFKVPQIDLVSQLQSLLHQDQLRIQRGLVDAQVLVRELADFRVHHTPGGGMRFDASEAANEFILALAVAIWDATQPDYSLHLEELRI